VLRLLDLRVYGENHPVRCCLGEIIPGHLHPAVVRLGFLEPLAPAEKKFRDPRPFPGFTDRCFKSGFSGLDFTLGEVPIAKRPQKQVVHVVVLLTDDDDAG